MKLLLKCQLFTGTLSDVVFESLQFYNFCFLAELIQYCPLQYFSRQLKYFDRHTGDLATAFVEF